MEVAPDLGAEVNGREDGCGVYPNIMEDVGAEQGDERKGMGIKVGDAGDVVEEVPFDKFFLGDPKLLTAVINDGILVRVAIGDEGTDGGGEEVGEEVS